MEIFEWGTRPPWTNAELIITRVTIFYSWTFSTILEKGRGKGDIGSCPIIYLHDCNYLLFRQQHESKYFF